MPTDRSGVGMAGHCRLGGNGHNVPEARRAKVRQVHYDPKAFGYGDEFPPCSGQASTPGYHSPVGKLVTLIPGQTEHSYPQTVQDP